MGRVPVTEWEAPAGGRVDSTVYLPGLEPRSARRCSMRHDETTYLEDDDRGFVVLGDDGEDGTVVAVTVTAGGRQWNFKEEDWGGWDAE